MKTKKGHSAGEFKSSLKHGVSNKFQASWLKEDEGHLWLEDHGKNVNGVSDSSSNSGCSKRAGAKTEEASLEPATVASRAAEFWAQLKSNGGCFRRPEWMKLAELVLVMVPGSVQDERMFFALKYLRSPQRKKLKEMHINVCARGFKSMECNLSSFPYPDAIGRWLDAAKKHGRHIV
eukprot:1156361-Pelagomonas_calceolata.AAC.7